MKESKAANLPSIRDAAALTSSPHSYLVQSNRYDWLRSLRRHWLLIGIIAACILGATGAALWLIPPQYRATTHVMLQTRASEVVKVDPVLSQLPSDSDTVTSEIQVIRSRDLIEKLVRELHLDTYPEFAPQPSSLSHLIDQYVTTADWLPLGLRNFAAKLTVPKPLTDAERMNLVIAKVSRRIDVAPIPRSRVITVNFTSRDKELVDVVTNKLAGLYLENQTELKQRVSNDANRWITENLDHLGQSASTAAQRVADFRAKSGLIDGKDSTLIRQRISELDTQLTTAKVQRSALAAKLDSIVSAQVDSNSQVLSSPLIQQLRQKNAALATQNAKLGFTFGANNPKLQANKAQMADSERRIDEETRKIITSIRNDHSVAINHEHALRQQLDGLKKELARLESAEVQLQRFNEETQVDQSLYASYLKRAKETGQPSFDVPDAVVISHATTPTQPFFPDARLILPVAMLLALLVGCGTAIAVDASDKTFRSQTQVEKELGLPSFGVIPEFRRDTSTFNPLSLLGLVMIDLVMRLRLSKPKTVLIASALPREGKTVTSLFLAHAAALNGKHVLLIDADLRRSGLRARLGTTGSGLSDILCGKCSFDEALCDAFNHQHGIDFISCGHPVANPAGLLGSKQMREFLAQVRKSYDLVLIDSPAVLAGSDAGSLAQLCDETLLFARWASTPREVVQVTLRRLIEGGAKVVGSVLTRIDLKQIGRYSVTDGLSYSRAMRRYYDKPTKGY